MMVNIMQKSISIVETMRELKDKYQIAQDV